MKSLKQGNKRVKNQKKHQKNKILFMSMGLPLNIVKHINRRADTSASI